MEPLTSLEQARAYFENDRFACGNGIRLDGISRGEARCSMVLTDRPQIAGGGVMGGAMFSLIDFAFAAASGSVHRPTVA